MSGEMEPAPKIQYIPETEQENIVKDEVGAATRAMRMAESLAQEVIGESGVPSVYLMYLGNMKIVVSVTTDLMTSSDDERMYIAVNPPGEACGCCKGSGKRLKKAH